MNRGNDTDYKQDYERDYERNYEPDTQQEYEPDYREDSTIEYRMLAPSRYHDDLGYIDGRKSMSPLTSKALRLLAAVGIMFVIGCIIPGKSGDSLTDYGYKDIAPTVSVPEIAAHSVIAPSPTPVPEAGEFNMELPRVRDLVALMDEYPSAAVIARDIYKFPLQMVDAAIKNNEIIDYVADYLNYGNNYIVAADSVDITGALSTGGYPTLIQWDSRWGYSLYNTEVMGLAGCGPTALAIVASGLSGDARYNPRYTADYGQQNGYVTSDNSTTWTFMSEGAKAFGITPRELILDANAITGALNNGEPIICSMGPGDFTTTGHFIVLTGVASDGSITIRDPNSIIKSAETWDLKQLMTQIKNLWAYKLS